MSTNNPFQFNIIPTTPIALSPVAYSAVQALRQRGQLSRTGIAEHIGYSPSKITAVVNSLLDQGIVEEKNESTYTGGRRAKSLYFDPNFGYILHVSVSNNKLDIAVIDFAEQVRVRRMVPISASDSPSSILERMVSFVMERLKRVDIPLEKLLGVGFTLPCAIDEFTGTPFESANLPGWGGYQLLSYLRERFPHAIIKIEKDANAMAFAELRKGRAVSYHHVIYVEVEDTVRSGLILNGQMYRGVTGRAGDIGDVRLVFGESLQTLNSLVDTLPLASGSVLKAQALEGNADAVAIIEQSGRHLGQVLATLITLLDPQLILIGGRASHLGHPFLAAIRRSILENSKSFSTQNLQVELAPLNDANLLGMVALTAESIFKPDN